MSGEKNVCRMLNAHKEVLSAMRMQSYRASISLPQINPPTLQPDPHPPFPLYRQKSNVYYTESSNIALLCKIISGKGLSSCNYY